MLKGGQNKVEWKWILIQYIFYHKNFIVFFRLREFVIFSINTFFLNIYIYFSFKWPVKGSRILQIVSPLISTFLWTIQTWEKSTFNSLFFHFSEGEKWKNTILGGKKHPKTLMSQRALCPHWYLWPCPQAAVGSTLWGPDLQQEKGPLKQAFIYLEQSFKSGVKLWCFLGHQSRRFFPIMFLSLFFWLEFIVHCDKINS